MTDDQTAGSAPIADPAQNTARPRILIAGGRLSPLRAMAAALIARLSVHVEVLDAAPVSTRDETPDVSIPERLSLKLLPIAAPTNTYGPAQKGRRGKRRRW